METLTKIYVGVDVSKLKLDVHLHPIGKAISFDNSKEGIKNLIEMLLDHDVEQIACESTGGYEDLMLKMLRKAGLNVWQVEPGRIKSFIRSKGKKAKTDSIDARMISIFASQEVQEHGFVEQGENHTMLKDLVKRKGDLAAMITMEKLRLKHPNHFFCKPKIQEHIEFMEEQVLELKNEILDLIDKDNILCEKAGIVESVPGIGNGTAAMLLAEMPELGNTTNKKIAALVGVAPHTQQSGQYKGKAFISGGRATVRSALYMAALAAIQFNPAMKEFYCRLREIYKKPPKVALVAVMRKLITILNTMLKNGTKWVCHV